jgi:hypothetical protein
MQGALRWLTLHWTPTSNAPDLPGILAEVRRWYDDEQIEFVQSEFEALYPRIPQTCFVPVTVGGF